MNFAFETQGTINYLVYSVAPDDVIDTMSLGMLTNNKIAGLAPTQFTQMDATKYIKYNISARVSARQFFAGYVNKKRLIGVFNGIVDAMLSAEDYMIDTRSILLDMDYIFTDVSSCETVLICLPIVEAEDRQGDMGTFFKNIMFSTQFDSMENCDYVAKIINYLNSTPHFLLTDFKEVLVNIEHGQRENGAETTQPKSQQTARMTRETPSTAPAYAPTLSQSDVMLNHYAQPAKEQPIIPAVNLQPLSVSHSSTDKSPAAPMNAPTPPINGAYPSAEAATSKPSDKKMSWFYLMQHYNQENVAAYKAQKEAKKNDTKPQSKEASTSKKQTKPTMAPNNNFAFAMPGQSPAPSPVTVQPAQPVQPIQPVQLVQSVRPEPVQPFTPIQAPLGQAMNFGETTVLGGGAIGETTVLVATQNQHKMIAPHLIRKKNNERISLNKPVFRIGKERSYVDYFTGDNTAISRSHANFLIRDGEYFVVDTNSKNHTFVNGIIIQSNVETAITHGDTVRLANEDFEFRLY